MEYVDSCSKSDRMAVGPEWLTMCPRGPRDRWRAGGCGRCRHPAHHQPGRRSTPQMPRIPSALAQGGKPKSNHREAGNGLHQAPAAWRPRNGSAYLLCSPGKHRRAALAARRLPLPAHFAATVPTLPRHATLTPHSRGTLLTGPPSPG